MSQATTQAVGFKDCKRWVGFGVLFDTGTRWNPADEANYRQQLEQARDRFLDKQPLPVDVSSWEVNIRPGKRGRAIAYATLHYRLRPVGT